MNLSSLRKYFPQAFASRDVRSLVITLITYAIFSFLAGIVLGLLSGIPILGIIFSVIGLMVELYCVAGIVLAILVFLKVVQ